MEGGLELTRGLPYGYHGLSTNSRAMQRQRDRADGGREMRNRGRGRFRFLHPTPLFLCNYLHVSLRRDRRGRRCEEGRSCADGWLDGKGWKKTDGDGMGLCLEMG